MSRIGIVCLLLLLLSLHAQAQILLSESFNTGFPSTWTIVNGGSSAATWARTTNGLNGQTLDGSQFMICNSDAAGNIPAVLMNETLLSPVVNAASYPLLYLEFDHYFRHIGLADSGHVEVFDGILWRRVASFAATEGGFNAPAHRQYNISAHANANLQVRFIYNDNAAWAWYWALDNVQILAPVPDDAGISAIISPNRNGRLLTQTALTANETVQVEVRNFGSTTLSNIPLYMQVDGGSIVGPEVLAGPLTPGQIQNFSFTATANVSALGSHQVRVWTALNFDANPQNDSLSFQLRQLANPPLVYPHCLNFEPLRDTTLQSATIGMPGIDEMDFSTSVVGAGRLRTLAGPGFSRSGTKAITLDRDPSGSPDAINFVTFTWNMAQFHVANDQFNLELWLMEHGDEVQLRDSVWVRGCDTCAWIRVFSWNQLTGGTNGIYFPSPNIDLSATLAAKGQDFSSSVQLRIGQEDNFAAVSLTGSDGMTFDDICLRRILPINAGVTAIVSPQYQGNCGDSLVPLALAVTNLGTTSLSNVPVQVFVTGPSNSSFSTTIAGPIAPGATVTATMGTINAYAGGLFQILAYTEMPLDSASGDDTLRTLAYFSPHLTQPLGQGDTVCIGDSAWVYVLQADPNLDYQWFDSPSNGNLLGHGDSLQVGPQFTANSYYVEPRATALGHLGPLNNQFGTGSDFASFAEGLVFDAFQDIIIDSVKVYPADTGLVQLLLSNAAGIRLDSVSVWVMPSFPQAPVMIPVGLEVPQGSNYRLRGSGSTLPGMYRNTIGANYPYSLAGIAQITGPTNGLAGYYYFWYDWVVQYSHCPGPRGLVMTDTTSAPPISQFSFQTTGLQVQLSNSSIHGHDYFWDFGDGNSFIGANAQHSYATDGNYLVCLIASGACGSDTTCQVVTVSCLPYQIGFDTAATGLSVLFADTTGGVLGQRWDFGDGNTTTGPNVGHTYLMDGSYWVCLENWNVCGDTAIYCDSLQFCGPMSGSLNALQVGGQWTFDFSAAVAGTPVQWIWDFGDGDSSSLAAPTHAFSTPGTYTVALILRNACGQELRLDQVVTIVSGSAARLPGMMVSPNPSDGLFKVAFLDVAAGMAQLRLVDVLGRALWQQTIDLQGNAAQELVLDLRQLPAGSYWLELSTPQGLVGRRVSIQP